MTIDIDNLDESICLPSLPFPLENLITSWNGRDIQLLQRDAFAFLHNFAHFFEPASSSLKGRDMHVEILSPNEKTISDSDHSIPTLQGRQIQSVQIPQLFFVQKRISEQTWDNKPLSLKERYVEIFSDETEENDSDFAIALTSYLEKNGRAFAHLEEFLSERGFMFQSDSLENILACKSLGHYWKKCKKIATHVYKKTVDFVKEHKEIFLGAAIIGGAAIGVGLLIEAGVLASQATAAVATAAAAALSDINKKEDEGFTASRAPSEPFSKLPPYTPTQDTSPYLSGKEAMDRLFPSAPKPDFSLYPNNVEKSKQNVSNPPLTTFSLKPSSAPSKNDADSIMHKMFGSLIDTQPKPPPSIYKKDVPQKHETPISSPISPLPVICPISQGMLSGFITAVKQGLEIIGRGMSEPELFDPYSPLDPLHTEYAKSAQKQSTQEDTAVSSSSSIPNTPSLPELPSSLSPSLLSSFVEVVKRGFEIIGRGVSESEWQNPYLGDFNTERVSQNNEKVSAPPPSKQAELFDKSPLKEMAPLKSVFADFLKAVERNIEIFSRGMIYPYLATETVSTPSTERSRLYKTEGKERKDMRMTTINGIANTFDEAKDHANYLRSLCPDDICVHGVYNHTNNPAIDTLEVLLFNYFGFSPITADLLVAQWTEFHENNKDNPSAKYFHACHSQGAIHTKNALLKLPEEIRQRIIVLAIAPATVIPKKLCFRSFNYASKNDFVPLGELALGSIHYAFLEDDRAQLFQAVCENHEELIWLDPHKDAIGFDHNFQSPTFVEATQKHIKEYFNNEGQYP